MLFPDRMFFSAVQPPSLMCAFNFASLTCAMYVVFTPGAALGISALLVNQAVCVATIHQLCGCNIAVQPLQLVPGCQFSQAVMVARWLGFGGTAVHANHCTPDPARLSRPPLCSQFCALTIPTGAFPASCLLERLLGRMSPRKWPPGLLAVLLLLGAHCAQGDAVERRSADPIRPTALSSTSQHSQQPAALCIPVCRQKKLVSASQERRGAHVHPGRPCSRQPVFPPQLPPAFRRGRLTCTTACSPPAIPASAFCVGCIGLIVSRSTPPYCCCPTTLQLRPTVPEVQCNRLPGVVRAGLLLTATAATSATSATLADSCCVACPASRAFCC